MQYPSPREYFSAVQHPERVFQTTSLRQAQLVLDPVHQTPQFATGTSAVVCKALVDGEEQALRFFIREDASSRDQYSALGAYFRQQNLTDCVATSEWLDNAIEVNGRSWPVLQMQWVEGRNLDAYVNFLVEENDTAALARLAEKWRSLIGRLQAARFAHGDLQHGNVLVDKTGALRLVDFDASWIVPFSGRTPPSETGHPNYQRPDRPWGEWMDTFPGLLVYTSLLALSRDTSPWNKLYDENNLLFRRVDFDPPYQTPAWYHVASIADERLNHLLALLKQCCAPGWAAKERLEELLGGMPTSPLPWWELIGSPQLGEAPTAQSTPLRPPPPIAVGLPSLSTGQITPPWPTKPDPVSRVPPPRSLSANADWWNKGPQPVPPSKPPIHRPGGGKPATTVGNALLTGLLVGVSIAVIINALGHNVVTAVILGIIAGIIALVGQFQHKP
jgi:eukaryotic-like serine/threonine-protein kinase